MISEEKLDSFLATQLAIARLGEKPIRFWWNSDIVDIDGGADLLYRLVGETMAPLSAIEGVLLVAERAERRRLSTIPAPQAYSLFCPEPVIRKMLRQRLRQFKSYPDELPDAVGRLVSSGLGEDDLMAAIDTDLGTEFEEVETSFGIELQMGIAEEDPVKSALSLASVALRSPRGSYTLPYYREALGV